MATNEILQFAETDTGTNLLTQAEYLADSQRPIGNQPGVARSKLVNKALRQASLIAAGVAEFLADNQANNITDSLAPQDIADYMAAVVRSLSIPTAVAGGTAGDITAGFTPNVSLTNGTTVIVRAGSANTTTTPTFTPGGLTAKTIVKGNNLALVAGDIAGAGHWLVLTYDTTLGKWVLANPAGASSDGELRSVQYFTSSGTWTKPAGLKRARITVVGGGGSGSGGVRGGATGGAGGGAGGAAIKLITAASLGATESVTIGAGGAAVGDNTSGNNGSASSFGSHASATGGAGAVNQMGGTSGSGSGGNLNLSGGWGGPGSNSASGMGGCGGNTILGGGGRGGTVGDQVGAAGRSNTGSGGGGGGYATPGGGGAGGSGIVIVEEFF